MQAVTKLDADVTSYVDSDGLQSGVGYGYTVRTIAAGVTEGNTAYISVTNSDEATGRQNRLTRYSRNRPRTN